MEEHQLIKFTPGQVGFTDFDSLKKQVDAFVKQRSNLAVTPETKKEVTAAKNEVGRLYKDLDDRRKEVKKQYEAPLKDFETQFKDTVKPLTTLKDGYMDDLRSIDQMEKDQRRAVAMTELEEMCAPLGLDPEEVEFDDKWLNAGARKAGKYESNAATLRDMQGRVQWLAQQKELAAERAKRIKEHAAQAHMDASGWTQQVTADTDTDAVIAQMDAAQATQRHEERVKSVDVETGEVTTETRTMRITGAVGRVDKLIPWLTERGFEVTVIG